MRYIINNFLIGYGIFPYFDLEILLIIKANAKYHINISSIIISYQHQAWDPKVEIAKVTIILPNMAIMSVLLGIDSTNRSLNPLLSISIN